jgi:Domain of unknown function (DUF892)/BT1 family
MASDKNLQELFHDTLKDIYFAEKKILSALPKMAKAAQSEDLKAAFEKHETETEEHVVRLEKVFEEIAAAIISFCSGFAGMLTTVATLTLAADHSPRGAEGFTFAVLTSIINLATVFSNNLGSYLFTNIFHSKLAPLVVLSAGFTAFAFVLVPLLQLGDKRQGEPAAAAITGV